MITSVSWHPVPSQTTHPILCASSLDKSVKLYKIGTSLHHGYAADAEEHETLKSFYFKDMAPKSAQFNSLGTQLIVNGRRKFLYSVDVQSSTVTRIPSIQSRGETCWEQVKWSGDGKQLVLVGEQGDLVICDGKTKMFQYALTVPGRIADIATSRDGMHVYALASNELFVWDARTRRCIKRFKDVGAVHSRALQVSGDYITVGDDSGVVNVYQQSLLLK